MAYNLENYNSEAQYQDTITTAKGLSVSGAVTLSGANTLSGASTISGAATISGAITSTGGATFTPTSGNLILVGDSGTATITNGSCTINKQRGVITTASLTTGSASVTTFDLKNDKIGTASQIFCSLYNGTNSAGIPVLSQVKVATAGSCSISVINPDPGPNPLNGTLKVNFVVLG